MDEGGLLGGEEDGFAGFGLRLIEGMGRGGVMEGVGERFGRRGVEMEESFP